MAYTESARGKVNVSIIDPDPQGLYGNSPRGTLNVSLFDPASSVLRGPSERGKVDVQIVSPTTSSLESGRGTTSVVIKKRIGVLFWTVADGQKVPLFAFKPVIPPDPEEEPPPPFGESPRGAVSVRVGTEPTETRDPTLWPYAQIGPANSPRGQNAIFAALNDERTLSLRGGITVSCAGVSKTINTSMHVNIGSWSVGVNIASASDPMWTLVGDSGSETLSARIKSPVIRSKETGNGDYLTELIQPDGTSLSVYKFGYAIYDTTNRRASYRTGAWNRLNLRTSGGVSEDQADPQYHRGPRASQAPAMFGVIRRWEAAKAISGDWQNAIRHSLAVAVQGQAIKRGSMNNGVAQVWPAFGHDYRGDRAYQVLDPPASGTFTLSSTVGGTTRATTQNWNVSTSTLQSAIRSWGGDYSSVVVTGTAGSSYTIESVRTNANTFRVSSGSTITAPGTTYANVGFPMGQYFVVNPETDIESLNLVDPVSMAIAKALQDFGGYVLDVSSSMVTYAEVASEDLLASRHSQMAADLAIVRRHFLPVTNNSATNIHGGGAPVRALAPSFIV